MKEPIICSPATGRDYWVWGDRYSFKTTADETDDAHALFEMTVNPGSGTPPHIHHAEDEMFYVTEGELTLWCGDHKTVAGKGAFVAVPKGAVHRWANESERPARSLVLLVPGGFDRFLMRIGTPVTEAGQTSAPPTQAEIEYAMSIAGDFNMEIIG